MKERIINIFLFINKEDYIEKLGAVTHEMEGDDEAKLKFLQKSVEKDLSKAKTFSLPETVIVVDMQSGEERQRYLSYATYLNLSAGGRVGDVFFEVVKHYKLPQNFLSVITPVRNGKISIDQVTRLP